MWYKNKYRRHLCDMHICDWDDEFLSQFSADDYCKNILTADFAKVDGMFYDMTFWPKLCYCDSCKQRWRDEVGGELNPNVEVNSDEYLAMIRKYREWMSEFAHFITDETKLDYSYSNGYVHFKAKSLLNFDMYRVVL